MYGIPYSKHEIHFNYWGCVDETLQRYSSKEFIVTSQGSITFYEADKLSGSIFHKLKNAEGSNPRGIGIFLRDPRRVIPCMIGIMKSGNYIVVIDVTFPAVTINSMIQDAGINVILTEDQFIDQIQSAVGDKTIILNLDDMNNSSGDQVGQVNYSLDDLTQILFTSGSSGKPKGAIKDYRYHVNASYNHLKYGNLNSEDRILHLSSFSFSGTLNTIFCGLLMGFSIYYYDVQNEGLTGLANSIRKNEISYFHITPTTFRSFMNVLKPEDIFPSVRICTLSGEKRLKSDILAVKRLFPNLQAIRMGYAGSEMHAVAISLVPVDSLLDRERFPSGKPCNGMNVFIWDKDGNTLPQGEEGEIIVHSESLARGYINDPELTRQKFITDIQHPNWQYFKTGDLGKIMEDGQLLVIGRIDNMIKIRGVRIELDSLENHISLYPGITQCTFKVIEIEDGQKKLVSYFAAEKGVVIPISDLRNYLLERVPSQQLPNYFIQLEVIPRTPSGKLATAELPDPKRSRPDLPNPYQAPQGEIETKLVKLWEEQIGIMGIGVTDDFFDVGGDSLLGLIIFSAMEEAFGVVLPVSTLINAPNIRLLARELQRKPSPEEEAQIIVLNPEGQKPPLFFIPGKGGYPTRVRHLSRQLGPEFPVYTFLNPVSTQDSSEKEEIEQNASRYRELVKRYSSDGPSILAGESSGGKTAYEVAQQMVQEGKEPPFIFLLDTYNDKETKPNYYRGGNPGLYYRMIVNKHVSIWFKSNWAGKKEYLKFYREVISGMFSGFFGKRLKRGKNKTDISIPETNRKFRNDLINISRKYKIKPYLGKVVLVLADRDSRDYPHAYGWDKVGIKDLVIEHLDCYHGSILFEPAVSELAKIIQKHVHQ